MALDRLDKKRIVEEVSQVATNSVGMLAAQYGGITVAEMTTLRNLAREAKVSVRVVKNTLARQAVANTIFAPIADSLKGQLVLAFAAEGPGDAAKVFYKFSKQCEQLKVEFLSLGGELLASEKLEMVAKLPTRDEALAQLLGTMQAPIAKLVATMNAIPSKLVRTIAAVKDAKS